MGVTTQCCEFMNTCTFFDTGAGYSPELNQLVKAQYCVRGSRRCARYRAAQALGRANVPTSMLPAEYDRLEKLLSN